MKQIQKVFILYFILLFILSACKHEDVKNKKKYFTENVVIVIMDGARYSETFGDTAFQNIPNLHNFMTEYGVVNTNLMNNGVTSTVPGHTALSTGNYQVINNSGAEHPNYPSIFQCYADGHSANPENTWIIASKGKLATLGNCQIRTYKDKYLPLLDCGINGLGSGYREDSLSLEIFFDKMLYHHPSLVLLNFRDPDFSAHTGDSMAYINGIKKTDKYIYRIWTYLKEDPYFRNHTTLFVTNDHGRHLDTVADGFISHGDDCLGCRHIMLYAFGPDFKQNVMVHNQRELTDISATIAELLQFDLPYTRGNVMKELFK